MAKQFLRDAMKGLLVAAVGGVIVFLLSRYMFADDKALYNAIGVTVAICILLIVLYIEREGWLVQRSLRQSETSVYKRILLDLTKILLLAAVVGGALFLVEHYALANTHALYNAIKVTIGIVGLLLIQYVGRKGWRR